MLKALENIRAGQNAGEGKKAFCIPYNRHPAILWRAALPQSLLIFILESNFFSEHFSEKPQSHSFSRTEGLVHQALSGTKQMPWKQHVWSHYSSPFLHGKRQIYCRILFRCKSQLTRTETALVTWFTLCNTFRSCRHKDNSYLQSNEPVIAHVVVSCFFLQYSLKNERIRSISKALWSSIDQNFSLFKTYWYESLLIKKKKIKTSQHRGRPSIYLLYTAQLYKATWPFQNALWPAYKVHPLW